MVLYFKRTLHHNFVLKELSLCHWRKIHISPPHLWKVMFFGTDDFSLETLKQLHREFKNKNTVTDLEIVTTNSKNPVRLFGKNENLCVHEWPVVCSIAKKFDIGLIASFGHLIPEPLISSFSLGMLNVHASVLPRWRGAAPVIYSVLHGDCTSGVTIMRIRPFKFDEGEIISTRKTLVSPVETATELRLRLAYLGGDELINVLQKLPDILESAIAQPQEGITYAPKVTPALGVISFKNMTAREIYNRYRALCDIFPLRTIWMGTHLRLHAVSLHDGNILKHQSSSMHIDHVSNCETCMHDSNGELNQPGKVFFEKRSKILFVQCKGGSYVEIGSIAPLNKKFLSPMEFYNGYLSKKEKNFWIFE